MYAINFSNYLDGVGPREPVRKEYDERTQMFTYADMSYSGFGARDVEPPADMVLTFDTPDCEPKFVSKRSVWFDVTPFASR